MTVVSTKDGKQLVTLPTGKWHRRCYIRSRAETRLCFEWRGNNSRLFKNRTAVSTKSLATWRQLAALAPWQLDPKTHKIYLATAELGPPAEGQRRPSIKPGTFMILVYSPMP